MLTSDACYLDWRDYFEHNQPTQTELPWQDNYRLSRIERAAVTRSVQQFQLGEWARGRGLLRRASMDARVAAQPGFLTALELFIAEEQRHSRLLGDFLDLQGIPKLRSHWVDRIFRRLRKLAGLEICVVVLVTAEVMAVPFYQALRDATHSPLLKGICRRLLCDEAAHLRYQAQTLALLWSDAGRTACRVRCVVYSALFHSTALVVWQQHRRVFHAAAWDWRRFHRESSREFERLLNGIKSLLRVDRRPVAVAALRLED